jgi:hypothetical protein
MTRSFSLPFGGYFHTGAPRYPVQNSIIPSSFSQGVPINLPVTPGGYSGPAPDRARALLAPAKDVNFLPPDLGLSRHTGG